MVSRRWSGRAPRAVVRAFVSALAFLAVVSAQGPAVVTHLDLQYSEGVARDGRRNSLDVYLPGRVSRPPLVVFLHGGGWSAGQKEPYERLARALCTQGIGCAPINTRMFPFVRPDAMARDCARVFGFLHDSAERLGFDPERMFLMGHSAGAHLVSLAVLDEAIWRHSGVSRAAVCGVIALSGVYDARPRHFVLERIFGRDVTARAAMSPVQFARADAPPFSIVWAERDIPGIGLSSRMFANALRAHGAAVELRKLENRDHVDYMFQLDAHGAVGAAAVNPAAVNLVPLVTRSVWRHLARSRSGPRQAVAARRFEVKTAQIAGRLPIALFGPAGRQRDAVGWLVLAVDAVDRPAATALAREVAARGRVVALVDITGLPRADDRRAIATFDRMVQGCADAIERFGAPVARPVVGAMGAAGWLVGVSSLPTRGALVLGSAAARAVVEGVLEGGRKHGRDPAALLAANARPMLLLASERDAAVDRPATHRLSRLLTRRGDCAVDLAAPAVRELARAAAAGDPTLAEFVVAFLDG
ncbi:MAG: alpha/beta hydrolase [bacterium]|nr:alpha/beta hydrolase [bacterium]